MGKVTPPSVLVFVIQYFLRFLFFRNMTGTRGGWGGRGGMERERFMLAAAINAAAGGGPTRGGA